MGNAWSFYSLWSDDDHQQPTPTQGTQTAQQLEAALNKALQTHPECVGLTVGKITRLDNNQGLANWDADCAAEPGVTISAECKRVFLAAKHGVQRRFDLAVGD
jgi:hypothetical protein